MENMEKLHSTWVDHQNKASVPFSMSLIQANAKSIYDDLDDEKKPFSASSRWFANFRKRYGYHNIKMTGEAASADKKTAILKTIIEEGNYSAKQIFNMDETALYWKKLPNRTYISLEESMAPEFKAFKDRLTVLSVWSS